ncbi:betaine aldehyde dehydrogenase [Nitzschia inconspicua]|uniref:Betaine aldehyde dehydrogenase n=1 Tax=Nitzschia inconspicua TaxID=303405 RepID=A0A9K3M3F8_9STRA|nr:betaine aldehyde dehydrogenase [Nitzschia inconspicua]
MHLRRLRRSHGSIEKNLRWLSVASSSSSKQTSTDDVVVSRNIPKVMTSWINGSSLPQRISKSELDFTNLAPATGNVLCDVQVPTPLEIQLAVESSQTALEHGSDWSNLSSAERGKILQAMANSLQDNFEDLVVLEAIDTGLPISQIRSNHIPSAIQTLEYYAAMATSSTGLYGRILDVPNAGGHMDSIAFTRREPLGVCVGIGGWNYPLMTFSWKLAPALCMGNAMIYKPSECTPITALYAATTLWQDMLPAGVLQVLTGGAATAQYLVEHPNVAKVSLTGSTATGKKVARTAADTLKRTTLELGGKSPLLIFDDCHLDSAVRVACEANFINNGQVCSNATRVYVQNTILDEFVNQLCDQLQHNIVIGDNMEPNTNLGPMMMHPGQPSQHFDRVMEFLDRAKQDSSIQVLYGGNGYQMDGGGFFVEPTVLYSKSDDPEIVREEVFGPVMTILSFDTEENAVARANASEYGLGAGIMTKDLTRAHRIAKNLQSGNVWVNNWNLTPLEMPFGPCKMSGYGQELGKEALEHFSKNKMVYIEMGEVNEEDVVILRSKTFGAGKAHSRPRISINRSDNNPVGRRYFSSQRSSWWTNPFATFGLRDKLPQLGSSSKSKESPDNNARKLQERKDATLVLIATQYRQVSIDHPDMEREQRIDMAFKRLEELDVDSKTIPQLRHTLQSSLEPQVVDLLRLFHKIDEVLLYFVQGQDVEGQLHEDDRRIETYCDEILRMELHRTVDLLTSPASEKAMKGADPKSFLELKRGAIERLLDRRWREENSVELGENLSPEEPKSSKDSTRPKEVNWNDADEFGYHESPVDRERNRLIRYYQAINLCRSAKLRDEWGFSVVVLKSSIPGAGRGVYVDGFAKAGSILAFQPGEVWAKESMLNVSAEEERQLERNDAYQMSLRPDDYMIDSRKSPYTVLTETQSNMFAVGHIVNHPTPTNPPNARSAMFNFTQGMDLGQNLKRYIPNTYARPRNPTLMSSLLERDVIDMHSMVLVATRDICNEEVFYDYRLATSHYPQWYHRVHDDAFEDDEEPIVQK